MFIGVACAWSGRTFRTQTKSIHLLPDTSLAKIKLCIANTKLARGILNLLRMILFFEKPISFDASYGIWKRKRFFAAWWAKWCIRRRRSAATSKKLYGEIFIFWCGILVAKNLLDHRGPLIIQIPNFWCLLLTAQIVSDCRYQNKNCTKCCQMRWG